jgi:cation transport regulator ChaB
MFRRWVYRARSKLSDEVTTVLDNFVTKLNRENFNDKTVAYKNKADNRWCTYKHIAEVIYAEHVTADVCVLQSLIYEKC